MCKFCDDLKWRTYRVLLRNFSADNNVCEYVSTRHGNYDDTGFVDECGICYSGTIHCDDCDGCKDNNLLFELKTYENNIGVNYYHKIRDLTIAPSSEMIQINFCPWCGRQLIDDDKKVSFDKCHMGGRLKLIED